MTKTKAGFTLVELIITIAIMGGIALIAVPSVTGIQNRSTVNADKLTGSRIGQALVLRQTDIGEINLSGPPKPYGEIDNIGDYISKSYKPESMENGYYVITQAKVNERKIIMVGITKKDENGNQLEIGKTIYEGTKPGWVWISEGNIEKFLKENPDIEIETEETPSGCEHSYTTTVIKEATCTEDGEKEETCTKCGYSHIKAIITSGHSYNEGICTKCGDTTIKPITEIENGTYITYKPNNTSYTVQTTASGHTSNQNFNPSVTTSWRVFSNDGEKIEIISTDSIGNLYLSGETGYTNAVQILQNISAAYVNSNIATSGRSLGYNEDGITNVENYKTINTTTNPLNKNVSGFPYTDTQYTKDKTKLEANTTYHNKNNIWLASRYTESNSNYSSFYIRIINNTGNINKYGLYHINSDEITITNSISNGVRPIITLKTNLTVIGTGTQTDPYVITTQ